MCMIEYRNGYRDNDCNSKVIITEDYKYVRYQNGEEELTNLKMDPLESDNVVNKPECKEIVGSMKDKLLDEMLATESKHPKQVSLA